MSTANYSERDGVSQSLGTDILDQGVSIHSILFSQTGANTRIVKLMPSKEDLEQLGQVVEAKIKADVFVPKSEVKNLSERVTHTA